jgi:hypothetical protein
MKRPREQTGAVSFLQRIAEQRILEAQREGAFDNLPGKGKPLELEDLSWVPEDLRIGYHVLKNAHVLPPEVELLKDIHSLEDLLKHVEDEGRAPLSGQKYPVENDSPRHTQASVLRPERSTYLQP